MSPYSINFGDDAFSESFAARVKPYLGHVGDTLGELWKERVEGCFSRADFTVVQAATQLAGKAPGWYVLEYGAAGEGTEVEPLFAGESRAHCIAYLLEQCRQSGLSANVAHDDQSDRTVFSREGTAFATIRPVQGSRFATDAVRARVEGTLVGLRNGAGVQTQFARRLSKWPRTTAVREQGAGDARSNIHWPCPAEWLRSARNLLVQAGGEPGTASAQALAAAVFDVKSWHHLCALLRRKAEQSDWWSMYSPYLVHTEGLAGSVPSRIFADPVAAFLEFHARAVEAISTTGLLESNVFGDKANFPVLVLTSPFDKRQSAPATPTTLSLKAVTQPPIDPDQVENVLVATRTDYIGGLRSLMKN
ncbi:hypothetical protein [Paraburkholderia nemoris]|uniref:hypothetical protein n=1 Tax=Paraburkholderia nemoris TaxID=2793076 RepID=UPI001B246E6A|nr:hypothetical protein [Paraburkholderia nemoris]CAE6793040.1 hypothetical protein LMG22931_05046 [Paraburkholderia nemoris]